ncbi:MAG: heparinase II/III domain-containing protein, partial [Planktothrix sp.]
GDTNLMNFGLWWRTLRDIPPQQISARINFEIKRRSLPKLPLTLRRHLTFGVILPTPSLKNNYLKSLQIPLNQTLKVESLPDYKCPAVTFTFLNETRTLPLPITWNSPDYSRLWQFNLHYFEWIRDIITTAYQQQEITSESFLQLYSVIIDWIDHNPFYSLDGWHPYTTSLRIVNWTYAIHAFPQLATPEIINSLWEQINYLYHNKEYFAGGNHLLENLRALIIGGLNFNHRKAEEIVQTSIQELAEQLSYQILPDGGHYERSPMYHLTVMSLVGESIACSYSANLSVPCSLLDSLSKMLEFAQGIRLKNGDYPLWNDAAYQITYSLDETIDWIAQLINQPFQSPHTPQLFFQNNCNLLHSYLLDKTVNSPGQYSGNDNIKSNQTLISHPPTIADYKNHSSSYHAPHTGYSILRNSEGIELGFDYGLPCPPELPPHAHADCLTLDLYYQGQPIIVDTGTSEYKKGAIREYERSTKAHNTIEIAQQNQSEIWKSFRVGRKAQPFNVKSGVFQELQWISAAHNGYHRSPLHSIHHRWIGLDNTNVMILDVVETDQTKINQSDLCSISRFHFAPNLKLIRDSSTADYYYSSKNFNFRIKTINSGEPNQVHWLTSQNSSSWYSPEFGQRFPRGCLEIKSHLNQPYHAILTVMSLQNSPKLNFQYDSSDFYVDINNMRLKWKMSESDLVFNAICQSS